MVMKRGVLFSLISILLSTFFIILFWSGNSSRLDAGVDAIETRVSVMSNYVTAFDAYVADSARLSTRATLIVLTDNLAMSGSPPDTITSIKANITSCLLKGFAPINSTHTIWCSREPSDSFINRINNFTYIGKEELGIKTEYTIFKDYISVTDRAPFELLVDFTMIYVVNDTFSRWNRSTQHQIVVNVIGLPDPLFNRYASSFFINALDKKRNFTTFPLSASWQLNPKNVSDLITSRAYVSNRDMAPTYLERLAGIVTGNLDPGNTSGIETLIDPELTLLISAPNGAPLNRSYTAHQLFSEKRFECGNDTFGIIVDDFAYPTFRMDVAHLVRYNVTNSSKYNMSCS